MIRLTSGGIDSIAALRLRPGRAIYFALGTESMDRELASLEWVDAQDWGVRVEHSNDLHKLGRYERQNGYLPYRNGLLVTWAAMRDPVVMVSQVAEWAPDKNQRYWRQLERVLTQAGATQKWSREVRIFTPYWRMTKGELLRLYRATFGWDATEELLVNTWSCYGSGPEHCGMCAGCQQRQVAEWVAGCPATAYRRIGVDLPERGDLIRDGLRWARDNRSVVGLVKRAWEVRRYDASLS